MSQPEYQIADPGWFLMEQDPESGEVELEKVRFFELGEHGITALIKDCDGLMVPPGPNCVDVVRAELLDAYKIAAMYEVKALADKATTGAQLDTVERLADWVMDWEPQRGW